MARDGGFSQEYRATWTEAQARAATIKRERHDVHVYIVDLGDRVAIHIEPQARRGWALR